MAFEHETRVAESQWQPKSVSAPRKKKVKTLVLDVPAASATFAVAAILAPVADGACRPLLPCCAAVPRRTRRAGDADAGVALLAALAVGARDANRAALALRACRASLALRALLADVACVAVYAWQPRDALLAFVTLGSFVAGATSGPLQALRSCLTWVANRALGSALRLRDHRSTGTLGTLEPLRAAVAVLAWLAGSALEPLGADLSLDTDRAHNTHGSFVAAGPTLAEVALLARTAWGATDATASLVALGAAGALGSAAARVTLEPTTAGGADLAADAVLTNLAALAGGATGTDWAAEPDVALAALAAGGAAVTLAACLADVTCRA